MAAPVDAAPPPAPPGWAPCKGGVSAVADPVPPANPPAGAIPPADRVPAPPARAVPAEEPPPPPYAVPPPDVNFSVTHSIAQPVDATVFPSVFAVVAETTWSATEKYWVDPECWVDFRVTPPVHGVGEPPPFPEISIPMTHSDACASAGVGPTDGDGLEPGLRVGVALAVGDGVDGPGVQADADDVGVAGRDRVRERRGQGPGAGPDRGGRQVRRARPGTAGRRPG